MIEIRRQAFLKDHPKILTFWPDEQLTEHATRQARSDLAKEIGIESWEEFYDHHQSRGDAPPT